MFFPVLYLSLKLTAENIMLKLNIPKNGAFSLVVMINNEEED